MKLNENQKVIPMEFDPKGLIDGVELYVNLDGYFRPWNDPFSGSVTNLGVRGSHRTGSPSEWVDLTENQARALATLARSMGKGIISVQQDAERAGRLVVRL